MITTNEAIAFVKSINTEKSLYNFLDKSVRNPIFREKRPNTHAFFKSLNDFRARHGRLTDRQKIALDSELRKNAPFFVTLRREVPSGIVSRPIPESEFLAFHGVENTPDEDSLASAEYDRLAAMDSE